MHRTVRRTADRRASEHRSEHAGHAGHRARVPVPWQRPGVVRAAARTALAATLAAVLAAPVGMGTASAAAPAAPADPDAGGGVSVAELDLSGVHAPALGTLPAQPPVPSEDASALTEVVPPVPGDVPGPGDAPDADDPDPGEPTPGEPARTADALTAAPSGAADPDVLTAALDTEPFTVLGVTWDPAPDLTDVVIRFRVREAGTWSPWAAVGASDVAPDADGPEAAGPATRGAADPVVAHDADGVQLWAEAATGTVTGLTAVLIDPGEDPDPAASGLAAAAVPVPGRPAIISRAGWGADESLRTCEPDYSTAMSAAAIHHTASANGYSADAVPGILRGFLTFHTRPESAGGRGWCDIGYNFLVDRFGRIFEGRAGGIARTVVGVHTGGFNSRTIGIAAIGDYSSVPVPPALTDALVSLLAWKFTTHGLVAGGIVSLVSGGGASKYPAGTVVTFPTIYGHRDAQLTACPGDSLYGLLGTLRSRVAAVANAAVAVSPRGVWDSTTTTPVGFTVSGWALDPQTPAPVTVEVAVDGVVHTVAADRDRPDVGAVYPALGPAHGFSLTLPRSSGSSLVCVTARNIADGTAVVLGCRRVTVSNSVPIGAVDAVVPSASGVTVSGWALDADTTDPIEVHVYVDGAGVPVLADRSRPDVAAAYGRGDRHGFEHTRALGRGDHEVCVHAIDTTGGPSRLLACHAFTIGDPLPRTAPIGAIDSASASNTAVAITGWALDPDTRDPITVQVLVDGIGVPVRADRPRPDVDAAFGLGDRHGFVHVVDALPGPHQLCVQAVNTGPGGDTRLGCRTVVVPDTRPVGAVDAVTVTPTSIEVTGWALDPDSGTASTPVHVYVDGVGVALVADRSRPDVAAALGRGDRHGFAHTVAAAPGPHGVCVYAINTSHGQHTMLTCRTVVVPDLAPLGALDSVTTTPGRLTVSGWTFDPNSAGPTDVHVYVDGVGVARRADGSRPDVAAAFGRGDRHGFSHTTTLTRGRHTVCVHGINTTAGPHTLLGCRTVEVP